MKVGDKVAKKMLLKKGFKLLYECKVYCVFEKNGVLFDVEKSIVVSVHSRG